MSFNMAMMYKSFLKVEYGAHVPQVLVKIILMFLFCILFHCLFVCLSKYLYGGVSEK